MSRKPPLRWAGTIAAIAIAIALVGCMDDEGGETETAGGATFSESAFESIRAGATADEVSSALGAPDETLDRVPKGEILIWCRGRTSYEISVADETVVFTASQPASQSPCDS